MIIEKNALHLKDIELNIAQKGKKIKTGLIKIVKLPRKSSW